MEDRTYRILVADGDTFLAEVFRARLQQLGFAVDSAVTGDEATERLAGGDYDLVLTEIDLPGGEPFGLVGQVLALGDGRPTCVVLTRSFDPDDIARASELGADAVVTKTHATYDDVAAKVRELLALRR
ncbi:response regulator [Patescibacteria group bacterium]